MTRHHQTVSATTYLAISAFVGGVGCGGGSDGSAVKPGASCLTDTCTPTVLATMQKGARGIVANATSVYWVRRISQPDGGQADELVECAKAGCNGAPTVIAVDRNVGVLAIDATSVYWTNWFGTIMKVGLAGGTPTTLASGQAGAIGIAVDATNVYWATNSLFDQTRTLTLGAVMKVPLAGGNPTILASNVNAYEVAVDAASVYWTTTSSPSAVMKIPIDGGAPTTLASGKYQAADLAVDGAYVYWTNGAGSAGGPADSTGSVMRVPIGGGTPSTIASEQADPAGIAVNATSVYWTNNLGGTVVVAPLGGGASSTLASGQSGPRDIFVDATGVYWANEGALLTPSVGSVAKLVLR
jgi:hypothetical protein